MKARRPASALGVVAVLALSACASLPTSGAIRVRTLQGSGGQAPLGIEVVPVPPGPGWQPQEIVNGFITASASFANQHAVASEYLTKTFAKEWKPGWAATVVASPAVKPSPLTKEVNAGGPPGALVTVTGSYTAAMSTGGQYQAGNLVTSKQPQTFNFALTQVRGQYRIDGIYRQGKLERRLLLLSLPDFETDYQPRNLYYFPASGGSLAGSIAPTSPTLIPEPVYIPEQASGKAAAVKGMVDSLLSPAPSPTSWLGQAATTAFPPGTRLIGAQVVGVNAVVDLGGTAAKASSAQLGRMAAEIYWSLTSEPYSSPAGNQIRSLTLQVNHRKWTQINPPSDSSWVPRSRPSPLYVQMAGTTVPDIKPVPSAGAAPVNLPESVGNGPFSSVAVTPGPHSQAVLAGCRGADVYLVPQWHGGPPVSLKLPGPCTSLSWDNQANLWVAAGGEVYVLPGAGLGSPNKPKITSVVCPASSCVGTISSLRVAPDGVRVAMIVKSKSRSQIVMAAVSSSLSFISLGESGKVVSIGSDIADPVALAWLDPDHLLVVGRSGGKSQIYEAPLNGGSSTEITPPNGIVTSITANWPSASSLPDIVVGLAQTASEPASVWKAKAGLLDRGWTWIAKGSTPVFPG